MKFMKPKPIIHLFSGGLDSTVMLFDLLNQKCAVHCVLFNYGQTHANRELTAARSLLTEWNAWAKAGNTQAIEFTEIRLPQIPGSLLTSGSGSKIVPNRNAILLSAAIAIAVNAKAEAVTIACNKDDAKDFPDCRREFISAMNLASKTADTGVEVCAPYIDTTKREIVQIGRRLDVNLERTWSCYAGGFAPCGACDACIRRSEAMA